MTLGCRPSGGSSGNTPSVAVGIREVALPPGETLFIDRDPELLRHGIDVLDVEVDRGVRPRVALVLRGRAAEKLRMGECARMSLEERRLA